MNEGLPRIWIITDPNHPDGPMAPVRRALEGCPPGVLGVQLRAKRASDRQMVQCFGNQICIDGRIYARHKPCSYDS